MGEAALSRKIAPSIDYAVDIVNLSKRFRRQTLTKGSYTTVKSSLLGMFRRHSSATSTHTTVIQDLTMRIPQGASLGVIGKNGSGKSTLLKLITGIYRPDTGRVSVRGKVAALIELGAGFHPDFTGRENLSLGAAMHGLSRRDLEERFDDIVSFAELEHVIDDPVRTYSSGMFMRLGFSLAVHTDPDVLIVDEVLAVGDAKFVAKCKEKISELRRDGKTLLLVTHDLDAVERWCDEALWLHEGAVRDRGDPRRVIDHYRQFVEKGEELELIEGEAEALAQPERESAEAQGQRWGSREVEITGVDICNTQGESHRLFHPQDACTVHIHYRVHEESSDVVFGIGISRTDGVVVHGSNTDIERIIVPPLRREGTVTYHFSRLGLLDGTYVVDVAVHRQDGYPFDYHKGALKFIVRWPLAQVGVYLPDHSWGFR